MIPCAHCAAPTGRIRTVADGEGWRHYYCRLGCGARFDTTEQRTGKPRVDRRQRERLWRQFEEIAAELRRVEG